jgi:hypothetical protein
MINTKALIGQSLSLPLFSWRIVVTGAEMTIARYYAREAVKRELYAQGIKLQQVENCEITRAANQYIVDHPEVLALASERYQDFVKRSRAQRQRNQRKPSQ